MAHDIDTDVRLQKGPDQMMPPLADAPAPTIVYVTDVADPGGAELSTLGEVPRHWELGQRVILACPQTGSLVQRALKLRVPTVAVPFPRLLGASGRAAQIRAAIALSASVLRLRNVFCDEHASVVCGSSMKSVVLAGMAAKLIRRRPIVIAINHEQFYFDPFFSRSPYFRLLRRAALMLCDCIVVLTPSRYERLRRIIGTQRAGQAKMPLDLRPFAEANGLGIRNELKLASRDVLVGMVGAITPSKGQRDFLEAAGRVASTRSDVRFVIVGDTAITGDCSYLSELRLLCRPLNIVDRVTFLGWRDDMPDILAALDVFVHPSHSDSFGRVVLEAMAAGKAVIATAVEGPSHLVQDGRTGLLVPAENPTALAAALQRLLRDAEEQSRLGRAAQDWALATFGCRPPEAQTMAGICARAMADRERRTGLKWT